MKHGVQWVYANIVAIPLMLEISCGVSQLAAYVVSPSYLQHHYCDQIGNYGIVEIFIQCNCQMVL